MTAANRATRAFRPLLLAMVTMAAGVLAPAAGLPTAPASAATHPAPGSIGVRLLTVPKGEQNNPRYRAYIVRHLRVGTTVRAKIVVSNTTRSVQRVSVYAGAASVNKAAFTFGVGAAPNELTTWTRLSTHLLVLKPDTLKPVTVTIAVPRNASRGQRYAVIWAQVTGTGKGQIHEVNRVGIRMYINVGPGGAPPSSFSIGPLTAVRSDHGSGPPMVTARVRNTGGAALDLTGTLRLLNGPGGTSTGPMHLSTAVTLPPGSTEPVSVNISGKLPRGPWHAVLTLRSGLLTQTERATLTFPVRTAPASPDGTGWVMLIAIILVVLLFGAGAFLAASQRSRHRGQRRPVRG
jgi:hypothetical protein